jgi:hypothetical protein
MLELQEEPEFQWRLDKTKYAVNEKGAPHIKLAIGNTPLDYDIWEDLRNPATIGLHPIGLKEIWEYYANRKKERVDESGRPTIFQIPRSFNFARKHYNRAVVMSVMLPFSLRVIKEYGKKILKNNKGSTHTFARMYEDVNLMMDKATSRVALDLVTGDNVVVAMNQENVQSISTEAVPVTQQGASHGPSKAVNYPQKSIAVLMGLGQFGISRIVFRDEFVDGQVQRFVGPLRSIIVFDKADVVRDGSNGIMYPSEAWRKFLLQLYDFGNTSPDINKYRFCTYSPYNDEGCGKCLRNCPSGAQRNSAPEATGCYSEQLSQQDHRFWEGKLQFDYARCCDERGQMTTLFPEWSCARCVTICAAMGNRRADASNNFYTKMVELTQN